MVNEQDLHEYDDDDNPDSEGLHNVTKYVEAISGANFAVSFRVQPQYSWTHAGMAYYVSVDGGTHR